MPSLEHTVLLPYLDPEPRPRRPLRGTIGWDAAARERKGRRAQLRARPLRPPALGPLLLRHHRAAEGDRPGPGRHPARAAEEAAPPPRRPSRRPALLVHDDRLDDVELPRLRPAHRGGDRPLRRQPRLPRHGRALGPRRAGRDHHVRHLRRLHLRLHEGRRRAGRGPRPLPPAGGRLDRLAARARGLRLGLRAPRRRDLALLDQRRHRPLHRLRRRRRRRCRSTAASCRRGRSGAAVEAWDDGGQLGDRARSASWWSPSRCPRCRSSSGATRTAAATASQLLREYPGSLAPRRLDRDHRRAAPRSSTAAPTRPSTAAASGSGTSEIYRAVLESRRGPRRPRRRPPATGTDGLDRRSSSSCARAPSSTTTAHGDRAPRSASAAPRATSPTRSAQIAAVPRTLSGKVARGAGQADPDGRRPEQAVSRDSLANPEALDYFVELAAG